jgi:hypothetical protein
LFPGAGTRSEKGSGGVEKGGENGVSLKNTYDLQFEQKGFGYGGSSDNFGYFFASLFVDAVID